MLRLDSHSGACLGCFRCFRSCFSRLIRQSILDEKAGLLAEPGALWPGPGCWAGAGGSFSQDRFKLAGMVGSRVAAGALSKSKGLDCVPDRLLCRPRALSGFSLLALAHSFAGPRHSRLAGGRRPPGLVHCRMELVLLENFSSQFNNTANIRQ